MKVEVSILVENDSALPGVEGEFGFSAWVNAEEIRFLFDTGNTNLLSANASSMQVDPARTDSGVLSHGHFYHSGGLAAFLESFGPPTVYAHPSFFRQRWVRAYIDRDISCPHSLQ